MITAKNAPKLYADIREAIGYGPEFGEEPEKAIPELGDLLTLLEPLVELAEHGIVTIDTEGMTGPADSMAESFEAITGQALLLARPSNRWMTARFHSKETTMKVLVVYEMVPEEIRFFDLELDAESEELAKLRKIHGSFANCTDTDEEVEALLDWAWEWLEQETKLSPEEGQSFKGPFDEIIYTGFIL